MTTRRSSAVLLMLCLLVVCLAMTTTAAPAGAVASGSPIGNIDLVQGVYPNFVRVVGWALDPDNVPTRSAAFVVYLDGQLMVYQGASENRPDIDAAYGFGPAHGFDFTFGWTTGAHQICVGAANAPGTAGQDVTLGCTVTTGNPIGHLDSLNNVGLDAGAAGWALDPDRANPTPIAVYVDGSLATFSGADQLRSDVAAAYPGFGGDHGFSVAFRLPSAGVHTVCVAAQNWPGSGGIDVVLGCARLDGGPHLGGSLDRVEQTDLGLRAIGWIVDLDQTILSIPIAAYLDGELVGYFPQANGTRDDVAAIYGGDHGFDMSFTASPGLHSLCLTSTSRAGVDGVFICVTVNKQSLK